MGMMKPNIKYRDFSITWFPMEEQYHVFTLDHVPVGDFVDTIEQAKQKIDDAYTIDNVLKENHLWKK